MASDTLIVPSAPEAKCRIITCGLLDRMSTQPIGLGRLHRHDIPAQVSRQIDVMDEIQENRPRAFFTAPGDVEIFVRLDQPEHAMHRHDLAEPAAVDLHLGALDHPVVAAMMGP